MSGHRKWSGASARRPTERAALVPRGTSRPTVLDKLQEHSRSLAELRRARQITQRQLGKIMQVSQAQVSRVENQADLYLSTLRSYIEAMGGELQIRVAFPGGDWTEVSIGDVTEAEERVPETSGPDIFTAVQPQELFIQAGQRNSALQMSQIFAISVGSSTDIFTRTFAPAVSGLDFRRGSWAAGTLTFGSAGAIIVSRPEDDHPKPSGEVAWRTADSPYSLPTAAALPATAQNQEGENE
jgi:transcriptional regulator with XRE-family HTH domain